MNVKHMLLRLTYSLNQFQTSSSHSLLARQSFSLLHRHNTKTTLASEKMTKNDLSLIEQGKKAAAYRAVDENIDQSVKVIGIGSGSTIIYAVERLAEIVKREKFDVVCIPSSFQAKQLLSKYELRSTDLETHTSIDVTIDGADEIDKELVCIKGGGACQLQEKLIAYCANKFVLIADERKKSQQLGNSWHSGVPIEVLPSAYKLVMVNIERILGGKAVLRDYQAAMTKAGPIVTDNGNFVIDWKFDSSKVNDWKSINTSIKMIPGVIETGLFIGMAKVAYFGNQDGTVTKLEATKQ